ncbi:MAG TPA: hypothetical protein VLO29_02070, partial [Salegentibacter sp.]|nr:hypothetical protein [Salegentibacter sp.]
MKKIILLFSIFSLLSCKNEKSENVTESVKNEEKTKAREIAEAHGFENFKDVNEIKFTFNVKVGDSVRTSRSWHWKTKTDEIRLTEGDISRAYVQDKSIAEEEKEIDQKFINDSYWLLFPYQLVWSDAEISEEKLAEAPIGKEEMKSLLVSYSSEGGYTPGDSYEIFYEDDLIIKEWIYRSADGTRESPTTWEDYEDFNGLKIAKSHKSPDGSFELFFSD